MRKFCLMLSAIFGIHSNISGASALEEGVFLIAQYGYPRLDVDIIKQNSMRLPE